MNATTLVDINNGGYVVGDDSKLFRPMQGFAPVTVGELFKRAEEARGIAIMYIEAAENMERLAKKGLEKKE